MGSVLISEVARQPWSTMNDASAHASEFRHYDSSFPSHSASADHRPASSSSPRDRDQSHSPTPDDSQRPTSQHITFRGDASSPSRARSSDISPSRNPPRSPAPQPRDAPPSSDSSSVPTSPSASPDRSSSSSPTRVKVRDLQHIQRFAEQDAESFMATDPRSNTQQAATRRPPARQYEISEMPVTDVIEMVAGLLTKITTTNDQQHEHLHRQISPTGSSLSTQASSVLAFHGKNIPSITILSYLSRIHKYCPTTYEVFLSLLVYFDRMTERVNALPLQSLRNASHQSLDRLARPQRHEFGSGEKRRRSSSLVERPASLMQTRSGSNNSNSSWTSSTSTLVPDSYTEGGQAQVSQSALTDANLDQYNLSQFFVVDSYNIHRLVIAGVTCASKFFSDVFYTNSRYAKVGGLPLGELNNLELQFLLLNDFRLSIPVEELEAYATMLVEFYAREIIAQHQPDGMEYVAAEAH